MSDYKKSFQGHSGWTTLVASVFNLAHNFTVRLYRVETYAGRKWTKCVHWEVHLETDSFSSCVRTTKTKYEAIEYANIYAKPLDLDLFNEVKWHFEGVAKHLQSEVTA
jgi:hypothetical protein